MPEAPMARYKILRWKELPSQVKAFDEEQEVKELLPARFQEAIDRAAMRSGEFGTDAYLDGWSWSEEEELPGDPEEVAASVVARLTKDFPPGSG